MTRDDTATTGLTAGDMTGRGLSPAMALLFALTCGLSVANIYFAQPLLDAMARDLDIAPAAIGMVVTFTQIGYALGLILIVPLGDLRDRRRLIVGQTVLSAIGLVIVGTASHAAVLLAGMALVGVLAVVVQVLVAFAATLATPDGRGRAIGTVTSGVVAGILLARFASGALADIGGWRLVYLVSAGLMLAMAALLLRVLPRGRPTAMAGTSYLSLLRSTAALFAQEPLLRERALFAFLIFADLNVFWTSIVLPLSAPPFTLSHTTIGLLGIAGFAGALAARNAGRLADLGWGQRTTGLSLMLMLAAWAAIACLHTSLWFVVAGVIMLDFGLQAVHVTSQSLIVAARPDAASRMVGSYMVFYSVGSAVGAIASTMVYAIAGWAGVCMLGAGISAAALLVWVIIASRIEVPADCALTHARRKHPVTRAPPAPRQDTPMKLPTSPFTVTDWSKVEATTHAGETGQALWRTLNIGDLRVRMVEYSPGYLADHWCDRGHVIYVVKGELESELRDGRKFKLTPGMSYQVSDFGDAAHRSSTATGATLFIVD